MFKNFMKCFPRSKVITVPTKQHTYISVAESRFYLLYNWTRWQWHSRVWLSAQSAGPVIMTIMTILSVVDRPISNHKACTSSANLAQGGSLCSGNIPSPTAIPSWHCTNPGWHDCVWVRGGLDPGPVTPAAAGWRSPLCAPGCWRVLALGADFLRQRKAVGGHQGLSSVWQESAVEFHGGRWPIDARNRPYGSSTL